MKKKGFSLMEMLAVITIVGILSAVALPQYHKIMEKGRFTQAQVMAKSLYDSCERMVAQFGVESWANVRDDKRHITSLDVVGGDVLPRGFSISGETVVGKGFVFSITGNCNISFVKNQGNYKAGFSFSGTNFTCNDTSTGYDADSCIIYGLD